MNPLRTIAFGFLRRSRLPDLLREFLQRDRVTIVAYHDPDPVTFERHLDVLTKLYTVVPLRQALQALQKGALETLPPKPLVVTFDDGHRGNHALKALFERHRVPVTIFVCGAIVDTARGFWWTRVDDPEALKGVSDEVRLARLRALGFDETAAQTPRAALNGAEMRELTDAMGLVDFQAHSLTHPILPSCPDAKAEHEIAGCRRELSRRYGWDVYAFAYPNGDHSEREKRLVREAGYACAVTIEPGYNTTATDPFGLKRICVDDADGVDEVVVKVSGLWGAICRVLNYRPHAPRSREAVVESAA